MSVDLTRMIQNDALRLPLSNSENPSSIADQKLFKNIHRPSFLKWTLVYLQQYQIIIILIHIVMNTYIYIDKRLCIYLLIHLRLSFYIIYH
jgi:hypothetical protein